MHVVESVRAYSRVKQFIEYYMSGAISRECIVLESVRLHVFNLIEINLRPMNTLVAFLDHIIAVDGVIIAVAFVWTGSWERKRKRRDVRVRRRGWRAFGAGDMFAQPKILALVLIDTLTIVIKKQNNADQTKD